MTDEGHGKLKIVSDFMRPIILKWEKLRILYNVILALILILSAGPAMGWHFFHPVVLLIWLIGAVLANLCFLTGPLVESYIAWLGFRSRAVTAVLFVVGVLISIPCVLYFVVSFTLPFGMD